MSASAICPRCNDLLRLDADDENAMRCPACGGAFVAGAVVQQDLLAEATGAVTAVRTAETETAAADPDRDAATAALEQPLLCPGCSQPMQPVVLEETGLDWCAACGGVWLDAGETITAEEAAGQPARVASKLTRYMLYSLTLPERTVRSTVGLAAGAVREAAGFLVPQAFRSSKTYEIFVNNSLRFLTEDIGGVKGRPGEAGVGGDFVARKAVGNFVEMAGIATFGMGPVFLLSIVSDVAYGSKSYVKELAGELKEKGLIDENSTINGVDDLMHAVQNVSGRTASVFDAPPFSIEQLKQSLTETKEALKSADVRGVLPEAELQAYWNEMREIGRREGVGLLGVSGALTMHTLNKVATVSKGTLTGVQVVGGLINRHILAHYVDSLREVRERGFYQVVRDSAGPYIEAVYNNFAVDQDTWTSQLLTGRVFGNAYRAVRGWFTRKKQPEPDTDSPAAANAAIASADEAASDS